ncbi:MAG: 2Fe-2S iron-sulfur cluster-binding protein [Desulfobacterales bacterium]
MTTQQPATFSVSIDGRHFEAENTMTVLDVTRKNGIRIPTLCYHPALKPSGSCRLCAVEVESRTGRSMIMLSCVLKAKPGMVIRTTGEAVTRARTMAFRKLVAMAPQAESIRVLAEAHGVDLGPKPDGCIRCRLCIRVCKEIVGPGALEMVHRDDHDYVTPIEGRCIGCGTCANICPTGAIRMEDHDNVRTLSIRNEIIGRHPLQRCEGCGSLFATTKFLDHVHDRVLPHPDVKEHHNYCPTCAKLLSRRIRVFDNRK